MSMGCSFVRSINYPGSKETPCIARQKRPVLICLLVRIFRLRTASMCSG